MMSVAGGANLRYLLVESGYTGGYNISSSPDALQMTRGLLRIDYTWYGQGSCKAVGKMRPGNHLYFDKPASIWRDSREGRESGNPELVIKCAPNDAQSFTYR